MRKIQSYLGIACLCFLTSCATTGPSGAPRTSQPGPSETYINPPSQFHFPQRVGSFEREEVKLYDQHGQDVGVGYNDLAHGVAMTVFVYPIAQLPPNDTLSGHFSACKAEVLAKHSGARLESEGASQISPGGAPQTGQHAVFSFTEVFARQRQPVRSELFVFTHAHRFVKYRVTYPVGLQPVVESAVRAFMDELIWP